MATDKQHGCGIAVVDDDPAVLASLRFTLEVEGYPVTAFTTGEGLLAHGIDPSWRCYIVDQNLPGGMTGLDLIDRLRDMGVERPAIIIATGLDPALAARAARAGIPLVEKPLIGSAIIDAVRSAFGSQCAACGSIDLSPPAPDARR